MSHLTQTWIEFETWAKKSKIDLSQKTILDIGCRNHLGKAVFAALGLKWTGIDKEPEKGRQMDDKMFRMDMTELMFEENAFDFVFACHSLEHCENPLQALREFKKVLKPDGYLFISMPCYCKHHVLEADKDHIFVFTDMQLKRLFMFIGLKNIDIYNGSKIDDAPHQYNLIGVTQK